MTINALSIIDQSMIEMGINYSFGFYTKDPIEYPYFVGEYSEVEVSSEDGLQETTFMITGFSRTSWADLENKKNIIEEYFDPNGRTFMVDGSGIAIMYSNAVMVPQEDPELKSIQINLKIKEWKV